MKGLRLIGVKKTFERGTPNEKVALNGVDLEVAGGDFITVLGSNGAGKSTLFNAILGKFRLDRGQIVLDGVTLLFVCTGDHPLNHYIHSLARQRGILTSVCDSPAECDFTSPAIYRDGDLTVSVASDGKDVRRSIRIRDRIKEAIEHDSIQID